MDVEGEDGEGEGGEGEGGEGGEEGGVGGEEGGEGVEDCPNLMFRAFSSPAPRSFPGVESPLDAELCVAAAPLFLARTAALWLERVAVNTALAFFKASGRAL